MSIDQLAAKIRTRALSGYDWFVPPKFEDAHEYAKELWGIKAMRQIEKETRGIQK